MAASDVTVANQALFKLGLSAIVSFDDNNRPSKTAKETFETIKDAVLAAHPWNFAMTRAELAADVDPPAWGFEFRYALPGDCVRVWQVNDEVRFDVVSGTEFFPKRQSWKVEGRFILTDDGAPLQVLYISKALGASEYSPLFVEALAARLAMEWAEPLTASADKVAQMAALYRDKLREARSLDGQEGIPDNLLIEDFLISRLD